MVERRNNGTGHKIAFGGKMQQLDKWGQGKRVGLVMIAQQFAIGAEACFEVLKLIKKGDLE